MMYTFACTLTSSDVDVTCVPTIMGVAGNPISIADVLVVHLAHCFYKVSRLTVVRSVHLFLQAGQVLVEFSPATSALWVVAVKETLSLVEWKLIPWYSHEREHDSTFRRKGDEFWCFFACILASFFGSVVLQVDGACDCQVAIVECGKVFVRYFNQTSGCFIVDTVASAFLRSKHKKEHQCEEKVHYLRRHMRPSFGGGRNRGKSRKRRRVAKGHHSLPTWRQCSLGQSCCSQAEYDVLTATDTEGVEWWRALVSHRWLRRQRSKGVETIVNAQIIVRCQKNRRWRLRRRRPFWPNDWSNEACRVSCARLSEPVEEEAQFTVN